VTAHVDGAECRLCELDPGELNPGELSLGQHLEL
jgi:hypothetical protein